MEHLRNILRGVVAPSEVLAYPSHYHIPKNGFSQDRERLRNDVKKTVNTLNNNAHKEYGKQKHAG